MDMELFPGPIRIALHPKSKAFAQALLGGPLFTLMDVPDDPGLVLLDLGTACWFGLESHLIP